MKFLKKIIFKLDQLIMWAEGWGYKKYVYHGEIYNIWTDPSSGEKYSQELAIKICEERIKNRGGVFK